MVAFPSPTESTGKSAVKAPAGIVTVAGTVPTPVALLMSVTGVATVGARLTVTVNTPGLPLGSVTVSGVRLVTIGGGAVTWIVLLTVAPLSVAETVAVPG